MARVFERIDRDVAQFVLRQRLFFVASAPSGDGGHLNLSPKGLDGSFAVVDDHTVAFLDLTGSGVETVAHVRDEGRIVLMFCAFEGPPRIIRLHGRGEAHFPGSPGYEALASHFPDRPGARSIIRVAVDRVAEACGFGVPLMTYQGNRSELDKWASKKGPGGLAEYQAAKNRVSIDGLPGLPETPK